MTDSSDQPLAIVDRVLAHLRDAGRPLTSSDLAERVLHLAGGPGGPAVAILESALAKDPRLVRRPDETWDRADVVATDPGAPAEAPSSVGPEDLAVAVWLHLTGPRPPLDRALSVAAVDRGGRVILERVCDPGGPVHPDRLKGVGLRPGDLAGGATPERTLAVLADAIGERTPVVWDRAQARALVPRIDPAIALAPVLARAGVTGRGDTIVEAASALSVSWDGDPRARVLARLVMSLAIRAAEEGLLVPPDPVAPRAEAPAWVLDLPEGPGVYRFLSADGETLYVGKARSLRARVRSYFGASDDRRLHAELMSRMAGARVEETGSEAEALLREAELIREVAPPYNVQRKTATRDGRLGDAVLFLPGAKGGVMCVLVVGGRVAARVEVGARNRGIARLDEAMGAFVFGDEEVAPDGGEGEILKTWLRREGDRVSLLDLSSVTSLAAGRRLVRAYLGDEETLTGGVFRR